MVIFLSIFLVVSKFCPIFAMQTENKRFATAKIHKKQNKTNKIAMKQKTVTISAYATDYNEKSYCLHYGRNEREFIPKSQASLVEAPDGIDDKPKSCYFEMPL